MRLSDINLTENGLSENLDMPGPNELMLFLLLCPIPKYLN